MAVSATPNPCPTETVRTTLCEDCAEEAGMSYNEWTGLEYEDESCDDCTDASGETHYVYVFEFEREVR